MDKKLEKLILEKLKEEVLKRDNDLRNKAENQLMREATQEALAEMTSLSKEEVEKIAKDITVDLVRKQQKKKRLWRMAVMLLLFLAVVFSFRIYKQSNKIRIEETFEKNDAGWNEYESFDYKRYIKEGTYYFENNTNDWCAWDYIDTELPENYSVEVKSRQLRGSFAASGVILLNDSKNYYYYQARADGAVITNYRINGEWTNLDSWQTNFFEQKPKQEIIQRVDVTGNKYKYYINDLLFKSETSVFDGFKQVGFMVCGKQTIAFDYLIIKNTNTGDIIVDENFEPANPNWTTKEDVTKKCYFLNGDYILEHNISDKCFWSTIPFDFPENFRATLSTKWLEGEQREFELVLKQDDYNFIGLELCADGQARYVIYENDAYSKVPSFRQTSIISDGSNSNNIVVEVENRNFKMYINDRYIDKWSLGNIALTHIGVRVCGKQKVAFENLLIEEL